MNRLKRKAGFSLSELLVAVAVIMVLAGIAVPTVKLLVGAFESPKSIKNLVGAALANARAMAIRDSSYVGVRFQRAYDPQYAANPLKWPQYMVFITQDEAIGAYGFRAMEGRRPIKLPASMGVMDRIIVNRVFNTATDIQIPDKDIDADDMINEDKELADTTTFSIVFSPAGKLSTHRVRVRNRDGYPDTAAARDSLDDVFNKKSRVEDVADPRGMFYQDDYFTTAWGQHRVEMGYGPEMSRNAFYIYDRNIFVNINADSRWTDYLSSVEAVYISPYTGEIINK